MDATGIVLMVSGTILDVFVRVRSLASAALAFFMRLLCYSLDIRFEQILTAYQCVTCLLNRMKKFLTVIFAVR